MCKVNCQRMKAKREIFIGIVHVTEENLQFFAMLCSLLILFVQLQPYGIRLESLKGHFELEGPQKCVAMSLASRSTCSSFLSERTFIGAGEFT